MNARATMAVAVSALLALIAWPTLFARHAGATTQPELSALPPAAVMPDYRYRNAIVGDFERDVRRHPDQLVTNLLAQQYLQRYRERADVGDLLRAVAAGRQSLALEPHITLRLNRHSRLHWLRCINFAPRSTTQRTSHL